MASYDVASTIHKSLDSGTCEVVELTKRRGRDLRATPKHFSQLNYPRL
jgi:hypothetical protein